MKITIDGVEYEVDVKKAVKDGYLKKVVLRSAGQVYRHEDGEYYLLASVSTAQNRDAMMTLVGLTTGNRYHDPSPAKNLYNVTESEWLGIVAGFSNKFKLIEKFTFQESR